MQQLIYISSVTPIGSVPDMATILDVSRRNNRRDGITGLLYGDGRRFLQALEGPVEAVEATYTRIQADTRHRAPVILSRRTVLAREFGDWTMAHREVGGDDDAFLRRIATLTNAASADVRATFEGFAQVRRAA